MAAVAGGSSAVTEPGTLDLAGLIASGASGDDINLDSTACDAAAQTVVNAPAAADTADEDAALAEEREAQASLCLICCDRPRELRFHPCGHAIACIPCTIMLISRQAEEPMLICSHCRVAATAVEMLGDVAGAVPNVSRQLTFDVIGPTAGVPLDEFLDNAEQRGPTQRIVNAGHDVHGENHQYQLGRQLARSGLGQVTHVGTQVGSGEQRTIKLEPINTPANRRTLQYESRLYKILSGGVGVLGCHWFGVDETDHVMVIDDYGPSLDILFAQCILTFSLKTILMIADQALYRVEYMHAKSFVHRDVKPSNFVIGLGRKANMVHIINFGLAMKYRDPKTQQHITKSRRPFKGTAIFASINALQGVQPSRRDDLEALGYMLVFLLNRGSLPWQEPGESNQRHERERILAKKMETSVEDLCQNCPAELATYITYCRGLAFDERPDYAYLRRMFKDLFVKEGYQYDFDFDWRGLGAGA